MNLQKTIEYICDMCHQKLNRRFQIWIILPDKRNVCWRCSSWHTKLRRDNFFKLSRNESAFLCVLCKKNFANKFHSAQHWTEHDMKGICEYNFYKPEGYCEFREATHTGDDPLKCEVCKIAFCDNDNARRHYFVHVRREYLCDICLKTFISEINLNRHLYTSTGGKPYNCDTCCKRFESIFQFYRHDNIRHKTKSNVDYIDI